MYMRIFPLFGNIKYEFYKAKSFTKVIFRYMLHGSISISISVLTTITGKMSVRSLDKLQIHTYLIQGDL